MMGRHGNFLCSPSKSVRKRRDGEDAGIYINKLMIIFNLKGKEPTGFSCTVVLKDTEWTGYTSYMICK